MATVATASSSSDLPRTAKGLTAELNYVRYEHRLEEQYLPAIRALIAKDLSEPYSIYVYRYFLYQWGHLCFMVRDCSLCPKRRSLTDTPALRSRPSTPSTRPSSA